MNTTLKPDSLKNGARSPDSVETLLGQIAGEFTERLSRGEQPDIEEYIQRHPQLADLLRQVLPALQVMGPGSRDSLSTRLGSEGHAPFSGVLGDFRIGREIGRGGMGVVYEAEQMSLGRRVALKVLPFAAALDSKQLQRFKNEAHAAAGLQHTNIVPVYFVGCERGVHFYAMQFVEGQTLAALIQELRQLEGREGEAGTPAYPAEPRPLGSGAAEPLEMDNKARQEPRPPEDLASELISGHWARSPQAVVDSPPTGSYVPPTPMDQTRQAVTATPPVGALSTEPSISRAAFFRTVANLGIQAAEALEHAHQLGVIHRDIKPANMMVDARGNLWITDFGLAHCQSQAGLTMSGDLVGTLRYMSPEQALAKRVLVDHRTDIYSLGVTFYELLTLEPAFGGKDREELLRQIAFEEPRPPRRLNRAIPRELETIVLKATEKNPTDRYATAQELADDLERYLRDEPIRARRPTVLLKVKKWSRRHQSVMVTAAVSALMLLVTAVVGLSVGIFAVEQERAQTENRRKEADQAAAQTRAVLEFVLGPLLEAPAPDRARGRDLTVAQVLNEAAQKVDTAFPDQPVLEAWVRLFIGKSYRSLGMYPEADTHLGLALDLFRNHLGPEDDLTLSAMNERGVLLLIQGKLGKAEALLESCLEVNRRIRGADHPETLNAMNYLALVFKNQNKLDEAEALLRPCLDSSRRVKGADHPQTLSAMNSLAVVLQDQSKLGEAERLIRQALDRCTHILEADHPQTLSTLNNLALLLKEQNKLSEAEPLARRCLEVSSRILKADHPQTLTALNNLALVLQAQNKLAEAEPLAHRCQEGRRQTLGADHPDTLTAMHNLAMLYQAQGKYDRAEPLYQEALQGRTAQLGADHPNTLGSKNNLATLYQAQGKYDRAEPLYQELLQAKTAQLGADHPQTLTIKNNLAVLYKDQRKYDRAELLYQEVLQASAARLGADHPHTLASENNLAMLYQAQRKYDRAEPLLQEVLQGLTAKLGADHPDTLTIKNNLALLYHHQGKYDRAEPLYQEALQGRTAQLGADHPNTLGSKNNLAGLYMDQGKYARAESLFQEAVAGARRKLGLAHPQTQNIIGNLSDCYERMGQPAKAEPLCRELAEFCKQQAGADSSQYGAQLARLGNNLLAQHKPADAELVLRDCLAIRAKKEPDAWTTFNTKSMLGGALLGQKKYADAEPLLLQGYDGMKQREAKIPKEGKVRLTEALDQLVLLYEAWGKKEKAAEWGFKLQALRDAQKKTEKPKEK